MKPPPFNYHAPATLDEAVALLGSEANAKLLAGGQSLMPMLNMRLVHPDNLIDINAIDELAYIREDSGALVLGAMTRQYRLEDDELVGQLCPILREAIWQVGHRQTRNRGTVGGSLCHLDPAAEIPCIAMALDGVVDVRGAESSRQIPMSEFAAFYMSPAIGMDEIVTALRLPTWTGRYGSAFIEYTRRHGAFSLASAAALISIGPDGLIDRASLTIGGIGFVPVRISAAENLLMNTKPEPGIFQAAAALCAEIEADTDVHASAQYRQHLARTLAYRTLTKAYHRVLEQSEALPS